MKPDAATTSATAVLASAKHHGLASFNLVASGSAGRLVLTRLSALVIMEGTSVLRLFGAYVPRVI